VELTPSSLTEKLTALTEQRQQAWGQVCALDGAIALCTQLIKEAETPPPSPESPSGDHA
jgi:hypothetical protein